jgi:hypothetical protein
MEIQRTMTRSVLQINIKDGDPDLRLLVDFLRSGEISSRVLEAIKPFYQSLAVAANPDSTKEDIRKAEHSCLSSLKGHMCYLMDKHYRDDEIWFDPDEFATVTINPSPIDSRENHQPLTRSSKSITPEPPTRSGKSIMPSGILPDQLGAESEIEVPPTETIADRPSQKDQEQSDETYRVIASKSEQLFQEFVSGIHPDHKTELAPDNTIELQEDEMDQGDEYEDYDPDDDDDDDLTDEEYLEKMKGITVYSSSKIVEKP